MKKSQTLLLSIGLLCLATPAFAGHWNVSYESSGECFGSIGECQQGHDPNDPVTDEGYEETHPWINGAPIDHHVYLDVGSLGGNEEDPTEARTGGNVTAVFTWVPDTPQDLPPTSLSVLEDLDMSTPGNTGQCIITSTQNTTVKGYQGRGLAQIPNPGRDSVIRLSVRHLNVLAHSDIRRDGAVFDIHLKYSAQPDTRSVKLTRGGRYEYSQLEGDEWHTYGDSIYSAHDPVIINPDRNVDLDIAANVSASWNNPSFVWAPDGFQSYPQYDINHCYGYTAYGNPTAHFLGEDMMATPNDWEYSGQATGHSTRVTSLSLTDSVDQAKSTAYYHLTLHDPVELTSSDLSNDPNVTNYTIEEPYTYADGRPIVGIGLRDENSDTIKIDNETSTEAGVGLKATADVSAFKEILGLSAESTYTSTHTFTVTHSTEIPKDIPDGYFKYLTATHTFVRVHKRFYMYDNAGEIRRMLTVDQNGSPINPPRHVYHELIQDHFLSNDAQWSGLIPGPVNEHNLPSIDAPPVNYDYPSAGSS